MLPNLAIEAGNVVLLAGQAAPVMSQCQRRNTGKSSSVLLGRFQRPQAKIARFVAISGIPQELRANQRLLLEQYVSTLEVFQSKQTSSLEKK